VGTAVWGRAPRPSKVRARADTEVRVRAGAKVRVGTDALVCPIRARVGTTPRAEETLGQTADLDVTFAAPPRVASLLLSPDYN